MEIADMHFCPACLLSPGHGEFTPGPWQHFGTRILASGRHIATLPEHYTELMHSDTPNDKAEFKEMAANAWLISEAPQMFDALHGIADMQVGPDTNHAELLALVIAVARIALEKATPKIQLEAPPAKLERCIQAVRAQNIKHGCCKSEGNGSKLCPNAFAVCNAAARK